MGDWNTYTAHNGIVIGPWSFEASGAELIGFANTTGSVAWAGVNLAIYWPFTIYAPYLAQKITVENGTAVSGQMDAGIYDAFGNYVSSIGATTQAGTSALQVLDITDITLKPGNYYGALSFNNTTSTVFESTPVLGLSGAAGLLQQGGAFPLPTTTSTMSANTSTIVPSMYIQGRVLT